MNAEYDHLQSQLSDLREALYGIDGISKVISNALLARDMAGTEPLTDVVGEVVIGNLSHGVHALSLYAQIKVCAVSSHYRENKKSKTT